MDRLRSLEAFKSVAERGSFTMAVKVQNMCCSSISQSVRDLEMRSDHAFLTEPPETLVLSVRALRCSVVLLRCFGVTKNSKI
jgi:DNA-binding transcriptional LysR family regulator